MILLIKGRVLPLNGLILSLDPLKICDLPKERGFGWTLEIRYFFNKGKGVCEGFLYHGKGGNENNFYRYKDCKDHCSEAGKKMWIDTMSSKLFSMEVRKGHPSWYSITTGGNLNWN